MKMLESASNITSAKKKYAGFMIIQREKESTYKFLRRIITEIILQVNSQITVYELMKDLEELTGMKMNMPFLLATLIFKDSGIVINGDMIWASIANEKLSRNILRVAERVLNQVGGNMEREELFHYIRGNTIQPLSDATLEESLFNKKTNLKWKQKGGKTFISLKK